MDKLLTLPEVAAILGISVSTAKIWASRRVFPVIKVGRLVRVSTHSLEEWLEKNTRDIVRTPNFGKKPDKRAGFEACLQELKSGAH